MPTLVQHLNKTPAHDLRAMAGHLHLSRREEQHKQAWIDAIARLWSSPDQDEARTIALTRLSSQAQRALRRLVDLDQVPAELFWAEYGRVRRPRQANYQPKPWRQPACAAEELYYAGLLHAVEQPTITRARTLCTPIDLRPMLSQFAYDVTSKAPTIDDRVARHDSNIVTWALVHDVGQLLIFLMQMAQDDRRVTLRYGKWLDQKPLRQLNQRLATQEVGPISSHKGTQRLRWLAFLATVAGLQREGVVTAAGRAWMQEPPAEQFGWLWQGWRQCDGRMRGDYGLADGLLPKPWPEPLLLVLRTMIQAGTTAIAAVDLVHALLDTSPQEQAYWNHHVTDFSEFEQLLRDVLEDALTLFAIVARTESEPEEESTHTFLITSAGEWLLGGKGLGEKGVMEPAPAWDEKSSARGFLAGTDSWRVHFPANAPLALQVAVAAFGNYVGSRRDENEIWHIYELNAVTLARAADTGRDGPQLIQVLHRLGITLDSERADQLNRWQASRDDVRVSSSLLLETRTSSLLTELMNEPDIRKHIAEVLNPTTARLDAQPMALLDALRTKGLRPNMAWERSALTDQKGGNRGALWLAARLYLELARHIPLPSPLERHLLDELAASFSETERVLLDTEYRQLEERLRALLDGETYALAPEVGDIDGWRELIETAAEEGRVIDLLYYSAGRNMKTRRHVTLYWIEAMENRVYMRAYCHENGDVRLFRLDRIIAAKLVEVEGN